MVEPKSQNGGRESLAIKVATLDAGFREIKEDVGRVAHDQIEQGRKLDTLGATMSEGFSKSDRALSDAVSRIEKAMVEEKVPRSENLISMGVLAIAAAGFASAAMGAYMSMSLAPLRNVADGNQQSIAALHATITGDETRISRVADAQGEMASNLRAFQASIVQQLAEIETQFRANDEISNLRWAEQMRNDALIYKEATGGKELPTTPFYSPHVGRTPDGVNLQ